LDALDKQIFAELLRNCRISYRDLGKKTNLSASSVKKRIDNLEQSGLIDHYIVALHPEQTNARSATFMVYTNASVPIEEFKKRILSFDGVYMILPLIDGNYYVSLEYSHQDDLTELASVIESISGVQSVHVYDVLPEGAKSDLPETLEFSRNELIVLGQLMRNPKMLDYDIANNIGWPTRKVKRIIEKLEIEKKIWFGVRWNPNIGRGVAFNLIIKYDPETTSADEITDWLNKDYPISYLDSRVIETKSTIFAVFMLDKVVEMEPIAMAALKYQGIQSCYAITYYNAILGKSLSQLRLEKLLKKEELCQSYPSDV